MLKAKYDDLCYRKNADHQAKKFRQSQRLCVAAAAQQRRRRETVAALSGADPALAVRARRVVRVGVHQRTGLRQQHHEREQYQPQLAGRSQ